MLLPSAWPRPASRGITVGLSRLAIVTLAILGMTGCVSCSDVSEESLKRIREEITRSPDARTVIDGNNQFALDLYTRLRADQPGNLFFAPCSISTALAMTYGWCQGRHGSSDGEGSPFRTTPGGDPFNFRLAAPSPELQWREAWIPVA